MFRGSTVQSITRAVAVAALCMLAACSEQRPTEPASPPGSNSLLDGPSPSATLVECPTNITKQASGLIDPLLGGSVSLDGTSVTIPAGAVSVPTLVELTIPASRYMEVGLTVNGGLGISFALPVGVTINYSRCNRTDVLSKTLSVWYIDSQTKTPIYQIPVENDDKAARSIEFKTDHFSGYAIAF